MYVSKLAFRTQKENPSDEFSRGAQLLVRAGFVEKNFSGVYTYLPSGLKVLRNVEALIRKEMDAIGGQEMLMPSLTPKTVWDTSGRWEVLGDILYKLKDGQDKTLSLAPTHEDVLSAIMVHHL
ncbi:MAG: proline--tRNA ligase, partial [Patescibacteria group bacterium]